MNFDPRYQSEKNGPLNKELRDRISAFRGHFTLADIGETLGFSGPFVSQLLREPNPQRVDSKHIPRIVKAVEEAERKHVNKIGIKPPASTGPHAPTAPNTLDYHLGAIEALGWKITGLERK